MSWNCDLDFKNRDGQLFVSDDDQFDTKDKKYAAFISISERNLYRILNKEVSPERIFFTGQARAYGGMNALWSAKKVFE